jgi:alkanesulfonate monooxygenase SsuD/methylene tetrahydromethanopterin reductase-like flavin-dependent oxidoreductase (luciferase family)
VSGVKKGVTLPQFTGDPRRLIDSAVRAEKAGLDSVWVFDHLWPLSGGKERPFLEGWTALANIAALTERVQVGTLATRSTLRHPALLAKMAATVGAIAPGRIIVGIGSGDSASRPENHAFGLSYWAGPARVRQLESTVEIMRKYVNGSEVSHRDEFVEVRHLSTSPRTRPAPAIWVGGRTAGVLAVAGRHADGWNAWGCTPEEFRRDARLVRAAANGRTVELSWGARMVLAESDREAADKLGHRNPADYLVGGPATIGQHLRRVAEAGAHHLIATFPDASSPGNYETLATLI